MQPFHKISLIVNTKKQEAAEAALQVADFIRSRGVECVMAAAASDSRSVIDNGTDLVLVLGGDGTVLRAVRDIGGREIPVIGINLGTLGYLTEIELHDYETALDRVLRGEVHCEKRMMLEGCRVMADGRVPAGAVPLHALNDIAITRRGGLTALRFQKRLDRISKLFFLCLKHGQPLSAALALAFARGSKLLSRHRFLFGRSRGCGGLCQIRAAGQLLPALEAAQQRTGLLDDALSAGFNRC